MTDNEARNAYPVRRYALTSMVVPIILSVALLSILVVMPQPTIPVNLPFKAETFLTFALLVMLAFSLRTRTVGAIANNRDTYLLKIIALSIAAFTAWGGLSLIWSVSFDGPAHHTSLWAVYLAFFLVFTVLLRRDPSNQLMLSTFAIVSIFIGCLCIFDYLTLVDFKLNEGYVRIRYGKYAEMLSTISPMIFAIAIYVRKRWLKVVFALGGILSWMTVMLSLSKGAFLGGLLGFLIMFAGGILFSPKVFRRRVSIAAACWLAFTIGFQVFFSIASEVPSTTNYITGEADKTRGTTAFRVFSWGLGVQMFSDNWLVGVGADSFGMRLNDSRIRYRIFNPDDPKDEPGEDYIFERAHNEPLQVAGELGIIGISLFALPFLIFAFYFLRHLLRSRFKGPPVLWASVGGMAAFAFSSMVSSFSFRSAQNSVVFFMVFAIGVNELSKASKRQAKRPEPFKMPGPLYAACWFFALMLGAYCTSKIVAEYQVYLAEQTGDTVVAHSHFRIAHMADPSYAGLYLSNAARNMADNEPDKAAINTRNAIDRGVGMALTYSSLIKQQIAAGLIAEAEASFIEALSVYPRSHYLRTEYIAFLEKHGRAEEAEQQLKISRDFDLRNANGWYQLITIGSVKAFYLSQTDESVAPPAELVPQAGVIPYTDATPTPTPTEDQ